MSAGPISPVIPSSGRAVARGRGTPGTVRRLPLAAPPSSPPAPCEMPYGIGRIDASGRVSDRAVICALGWRSGDRLTLTADGGVVVARRDAGGMSVLPSREYLVIPAVLRRRCGLRAGDLVLLAAVPGEDALAAYPIAVVDEALRAHAAFPRAEGSTT
jgi:bifunctional DNA-binding transcriptional regulator/antitoxin component of YhaV-PrlF toxin-antitoxin module